MKRKKQQVALLAITHNLHFSAYLYIFQAVLVHTYISFKQDELKIKYGQSVQ